jgi:hypothetical protein
MRIALIAALTLMLGLSFVARAEEEKTKEEKITAEAVPAKVMEAFKKEYAAVDIKTVAIEKETYPDGTVHYGFEWKVGDEEHEAEYNADGEKLDEDKDEHEGHEH